MKKLIDIIIYTKNGDKIYVDGVEWDKFKKEIKSKKFDGSFKMNNGDLVELVN